MLFSLNIIGHQELQKLLHTVPATLEKLQGNGNVIE